MLLNALNYWSDLRELRATLQRELTEELKALSSDVRSEIDDHDDGLMRLARSQPLLTYVYSQSTGTADPPPDLQIGIASLLGPHSHFASITLHGDKRNPVLYAERSEQNRFNLIVFRTSNFLPGPPLPDEQIWNSNAPALIHWRSTSLSYGSTLYSTVAIIEEESSNTRRAALVGELKLESLFAEAAKRWQPAASESPLAHLVIVLDPDGRILYHPNDALKHQLVSNSMPMFMPVATRMLSDSMGFEKFYATNGDEYDAAFNSIPELGVSVAVASKYSQTAFSQLRRSWMPILFSFFIAGIAALMLTHYSQRKSRGFERVKEGVAAIAKGELDHRIEVQSEDGARPLADNVNLMTERLREQIARETEARQFDSFVKLSALLTHDLKNAIEALSLIVGNMERHFDNEEFRADALKALTSSTEKLKSLVARLSSPVTTLSGEHRRPANVDLAALLKHVSLPLSEPFKGIHEVKLILPESLYVLADGERIEKVIENLVLNALEAMSNRKGILTIEAGTAGEGKVFFSVSDTGRGIPKEFIAERLFRPFATTKKTGVGLGLYTCREVVRAHEGSITVESIEDVGTTFRVVLPSPPLMAQTS